jgi:hypothetical protein
MMRTRCGEQGEQDNMIKAGVPEKTVLSAANLNFPDLFQTPDRAGRKGKINLPKRGQT